MENRSIKITTVLAAGEWTAHAYIDKQHVASCSLLGKSQKVQREVESQARKAAEDFLRKQPAPVRPARLGGYCGTIMGLVEASVGLAEAGAGRAA